MPSLTLESTCGEAVEKLKASGASCLAVCDANGKAIGIMPATDLMTRLAKRKVTLSDNVAYICLKVFRSVSGHMPVSELARVLGRYPNAVVNSKNGKPRCVSSADLVQFMGQQMGGAQAKEEVKEAPKTSEVLGASLTSSLA
jgi:predicted transcriptional regulator